MVSIQSRQNNMYIPVTRTKAYEQIISQIRKRILSKALEPGNKLPTEVQLAKDFQVSRTVIREAMKVLETMGLIEVKHGSGVFVTDKFSEKLISQSFNLSVLLEKRSLLHILELRKILEVSAAKMAAERASREHLGLMQRALLSMEENIKSSNSVNIHKLLNADFDFHLTILEATKNPILAAIAKPIVILLRNSRKRLLGIVGAPQISFRQHQAIYSAIKKGDGKEASGAMFRHLKQVEEDIKRITDIH